jgi:hypothetical protein
MGCVFVSLDFMVCTYFCLKIQMKPTLKITTNDFLPQGNYVGSVLLVFMEPVKMAKVEVGDANVIF